MNQLAIKAKKIFCDSLQIVVRGGTGGAGLPQYGGIGGKGGDVIIKGSKKIESLRAVSNKRKSLFFLAPSGQAARRTHLLGEPGKDLKIEVPCGVTVVGEERQILGDINSSRDEMVVAYGGRGGDKYNDNQGFVGQQRILRLELKLISDAVFVGYPNAGKSSLLRAVSNATPKVANYPFTTLKPSLGMVNFSDFRTISMADLPGLIEGAHKNLGLGHEFLKHIIRARLLIFVVDINQVNFGVFRSPLETLCILLKEIELYDDTILNKPAMIVISKMDSLEDSEERFEKLKSQILAMQKDPLSVPIDDELRPRRMIQFDDILPISSLTTYNIDRLKKTAREVIDKHCEAEGDFKTYKELQPLENNRLLQ